MRSEARNGMAIRLRIGKRKRSGPRWEDLDPCLDGVVHPAPPKVGMAALSYDPLNYGRGPRGRVPSPEARAIVLGWLGLGSASPRSAV